jgi:hypothetical protein
MVFKVIIRERIDYDVMLHCIALTPVTGLFSPLIFYSVSICGTRPHVRMCARTKTTKCQHARPFDLASNIESPNKIRGAVGSGKKSHLISYHIGTPSG